MDRVTGEALRRMLNVLAEHVRQKSGCLKLQYTPYGSCPKCQSHDLCAEMDKIGGLMSFIPKKGG